MVSNHTQVETQPSIGDFNAEFPIRLFTIAWTGGLEDPSFASATNEAKARETFAEWKSQADETFDRIALIEHTIEADGTVTDVFVEDWSKAWADDAADSAADNQAVDATDGEG